MCVLGAGSVPRSRSSVGPLWAHGSPLPHYTAPPGSSQKADMPCYRLGPEVHIRKIRCLVENGSGPSLSFTDGVASAFGADGVRRRKSSEDSGLNLC